MGMGCQESLKTPRRRFQKSGAEYESGR